MLKNITIMLKEECLRNKKNSNMPSKIIIYKKGLTQQKFSIRNQY